MYFRQLLNDATACASYLFGCGSKRTFAVVDPHVDLVGEYVRLAQGQGAEISAVFETHLQADHVSGLPDLVARTGATAYLPADAGVDFEHVPLSDGDEVELGNTLVLALATPGHAAAHHTYALIDRRRAPDPWIALTGDALLVGDAGRPDLHADAAMPADEMARLLHRSIRERILALPDHVLLYPAHYSGSVCGRGLSGVPVSTVGFERAHNRALQAGDEEAFAAELLRDMPPAPAGQAEILAANRAGRPRTPA